MKQPRLWADDSVVHIEELVPDVRQVRHIQFKVPGIPVPQGSTRAFVVKGKGGAPARAVTTAANPRTKGWRNDVAALALEHAPPALWTGPVLISMAFRFPRPASVPRHKREWPVTKPDLDKLIRAIYDALTGIVWKDDAQVVSSSESKSYDDDEPAGVTILVKLLE